MKKVFRKACDWRTNIHNEMLFGLLFDSLRSTATIVTG